jgi:hypothetical protein
MDRQSTHQTISLFDSIISSTQKLIHGSERSDDDARSAREKIKEELRHELLQLSLTFNPEEVLQSAFDRFDQSNKKAGRNPETAAFNSEIIEHASRSHLRLIISDLIRKM